MNKQQRELALRVLGKDLSRRAKSRCELCETNTSLYAFEIPPFPEEPTLDTSLFLCDNCKNRMQSILLQQKSLKGPQELLFLSNDLLFLQEKIWSDIPVVQVAAVLISHKAIKLGFGWAIEMMDGLYLEEENSNWVTEILGTTQL